MNPPVSVIIPTFNRRKFLERAVQSVLAQTYDRYEIVVVDDGSEDAAIELPSLDASVRLLRQENRGPAGARNTGIRAAKHDLIAFLDDDDRFDPRKLEIQVAAMEENPSFLISHTDEIWYRRGKHLNQKNKHRRYGGNIFRHCLPLCAVGMSTSMVRRSLFDRTGMFNETFPCCEDYDFWLRASIDHEFLLVDQPLTIKDGGREDQVSNRFRVGMDQYRITAIRQVMESGRLDEEQLELARLELIRKCRIYGNGCVKHGKAEEGKSFLDLAEKFS